MSIQIDKSLQRECETDFQRGHGRAQVRKLPSGALVRSCETLTQAKYLCDPECNEAVFWRAKVRGQRRYEWVRA